MTHPFLQRIVGEVDDIPEALGNFCHKRLPDELLRRLNDEELGLVDCEAGKCRFCGKSFEHTHFVAYDGKEWPLIQCNATADKWPKIQALRNRIFYEQEQDLKRKMKELQC